MLKLLVSFIVCLFYLSSAQAQLKVDRPYQFQANFSSVLMQMMGKTFYSSDVEELNVEDWSTPGVSIGYHLNKRVYIGYSYHPNRNLVLSREWRFNGNENDGMIEVDHHTGQFHTLELRWSPYRNGFYASIFATHITKANYTLDFIRLDSTMQLGSNDYASDVEAEWHAKKINTIGLGLGYNFISSKAFSLGIGLGVPITINQTYHQEITLASKQAVTFKPLDESLGIKTIREDRFYYPVQFYFSAGINLKRLFVKRNPFS
ncbi:MAG: hypothetical protein HKN75_10075 [Bacteroidia bacterium]|nr:hypothetical protein [Bacteroidia bacterium]